MDIFNEIRDCNIDSIKKWLSDPNNDVNACDFNGISLSHWVCLKSNTEVFNILKNSGALFYSMTNLKDTPLHFAVSYGRIEIIRELLKLKVPVNCQNSIGNTPLHYACFWNQVNIAEILVRYGASVDIKNNMELTPLEIAPIYLSDYLKKIIKSLLSYDFDPLTPFCLEYGTDLPYARDMQIMKLPKMLKREKLEIKEPLTNISGNFKVFSGTYNDINVLVKEYRIKSKNHEELMNDLNKTIVFSCSFIHSTLGFICSQHSVQLVSSAQIHSNLYDLIDNLKIKLKIERVVELLYNIVCGMEFLFSSKIKYESFNLNTKNVLVSHSFVAKIDLTNLNLKYYNDKRCYNTYYMSRDALMELPSYENIERFNIWSFGVIAYELIQSKLIKPNNPEMFIAYQIINYKFQLPELEDSNVRMVKISQLCRNSVPNKRPTFSQIKTLLEKMNDQFR